MVSGRRRVGYLGPQGTFSEEALLASALAEVVEPVPLASIYEAVLALRRGDVEYSVVPIENSLEGSINVTLDLLAEQAGEVTIVGEAQLRVRHSLIAAGPLVLEEIDTIFTHPQVPGQCTRFLRGPLEHARVLPASSTAEAVRAVVAEAQPGHGALGTLLAARIYGGTVLAEGVQDRDDNETRFVWLARTGEDQAPAPLRETERTAWKTSIVFWGLGAERPGWLVRSLDELARRGINLTKIESRPRREQMGSYMFFLDLDGRLRDRAVADAVEGIGSLCEEVRVLGSYRTAAGPPAA